MKKIKEEICESELFIIRRFFIYPINKIKFEKFLYAIFGKKRMMVHNLFIFAIFKECAKKNNFHFPTINRLKHIKSIFKKEKTNCTDFLVFTNSINAKNIYLNEKITSNLKINNIRYELGWKFKKMGKFFPIKYYSNISSLIYKIIQISLKIKSYHRFTFIEKFSFALKSIIKDLFYFF
jgi:hypothetical protein